MITKFKKLFLIKNIAIVICAGFLLLIPIQKTFAFSPSDLPNLKLWLDPTTGTYTDTGLVTPATTDGSNVKGWADQSGIGNNATGTVQAILKLGSNGINGHTALSFVSGNGRLSTNSFLSSAYDHAVTMYIVMSLPASQAISMPLSNGAGFYVNGQSVSPQYFGIVSPGIAQTSITATTSNAYVLSVTINGTEQMLRLNNVLRQLYTVANAGLSGSLMVGGYPGNYTWKGLIGDTLVYNSAQTQAQMEQVTDYLMKKYGISNLLTLPKVAIEGNSWVAGNGSSNFGVTDISGDIINILGNSYSYSTMGVGGRTISTLITQAPTEIDPSLNLTQPTNIFVGWEIGNQLSGSTPAQVITLLQQWFGDRATAGWNKRIVIDCLPTVAGANQTAREQTNALLAALFPTPTAYPHVYKAAPTTTWADYEVRVSEDPNMGSAGQNQNTTYYFDGIHPNDTGYAVLAPYFANAISLANDASVIPTVNTFGIPATSNSLTVSITTPFTATDNVGVTGYMATTTSTAPSASDSTWQGTAPTSYTFSSAGSKTLYAWVKDAAGNVSTSASAPVTITLTTPTLSVTNSPVTYNTSPQAATVSGSVAGVVSNIQYNGSATVPTNAGTYAITADFAPTDSANYNSLTGASAGNFIINKANQGALTAISTPSTVPYGTTATLSSSGGSGTGAVTFSVGASTGCNITGGTTLNVNDASGTCTTTATKAADTNYNSVTSAGLSVTLTKATQGTLTFTGQTVTTPTTFSALSTTGGSGTGAVTYAVTTAGTAGCSVVGTTLSYTTVGTCGVTATKAADSNYNSVSSSEATFTINVAPVVTTVITVVGGNGPVIGGGSISLPGQVKPRQQIVYPDGHIVYLDTPTPNTTTTTSTNDTNTITPTPTYIFTRDISLHTTSSDVKKLQQFLNTHGFLIATSGAGSPGKETTLFGTLTYKALVKFQKSVGLPATGFFGPLTRAYIGKH